MNKQYKNLNKKFFLFTLIVLIFKNYDILINLLDNLYFLRLQVTKKIFAYKHLKNFQVRSSKEFLLEQNIRQEK